MKEQIFELQGNIYTQFKQLWNQSLKKKNKAWMGKHLSYVQLQWSIVSSILF